MVVISGLWKASFPTSMILSSCTSMSTYFWKKIYNSTLPFTPFTSSRNPTPSLFLHRDLSALLSHYGCICTLFLYWMIALTFWLPYTTVVALFLYSVFVTSHSSNSSNWRLLCTFFRNWSEGKVVSVRSC